MAKLSLKRALLEGAGYEEFILDEPASMSKAPGVGLAYISSGGSSSCGAGCDCESCNHKHQKHDHTHSRDRHAKSGDELEMVLSNLDQIIRQAQDLVEMMHDCDDVEEWVQEKIATSADRIDAVHGYVSYKVGGSGSHREHHHGGEMGVFTLQEEIEEIEKSMQDEMKTSRYDDEMKKAGFSPAQSKRLPDELQKGILLGKKKG